MNKSYNTIKISVENHIAIIILNRPDKRNSLNREMVKELKSAINYIYKIDNLIGLIITGEGKAFCAGADLEYLKSLLNATYEDNLNDSIELKDLYYMIYTFPKPTLAMVNGPAVAGGCGLVNVCDFVFSVDNAKFGYPEVKIGFLASIVSIFLAQSIGERNAKKLLLTGSLISAEKALSIGLIDKIIPKDEMKSFCINYLNELKDNSSQSINNTKKLFYDIIFEDLENKLLKACEFNVQSRKSNDFKEGINSFLEKRKPNWTKT